jgi:thiol peroxidase
MAEITFKGEVVHTCGMLPDVGQKAPAFTLTDNDLIDRDSDSFQADKIVLNIFPSLDTSVCSATVRRFNEEAAALDKAVVLCISMDLPFAQERFCAAEGIEDVITLSAFRHREFGEAYGVTITDGPLAGLFARAVLVIDGQHTIIHSQLVPEIASEPDYDAAIEAAGK